MGRADGKVTLVKNRLSRSKGYTRYGWDGKVMKAIEELKWKAKPLFRWVESSLEGRLNQAYGGLS